MPGTFGTFETADEIIFCLLLVTTFRNGEVGDAVPEDGSESSPPSILRRAESGVVVEWRRVGWGREARNILAGTLVPDSCGLSHARTSRSVFAYTLHFSVWSGAWLVAVHTSNFERRGKWSRFNQKMYIIGVGK